MTRRCAPVPVHGPRFRVAAHGVRRAGRFSLSAFLLLAFALALPSPKAGAICDVIPGVESEFPELRVPATRTVVGAAAICPLVAVLRIWGRRVPAPLLAVSAAALTSSAFRFPGEAERAAVT